jgi:hypothetical protein
MKNHLFIILLFVSLNILAQESANNRRFEVELGLTSNIHQPGHEIEYWESNHGNSVSLYSERRPTLGYSITAGYKLKISETSFLIPKLSFSNLKENTHAYEKTVMEWDFGSYYFNGVKITKKERYYASIAFTFEKVIKRIKIENGLGLSYRLGQKNEYYSYDFSTNRETNTTDNKSTSNGIQDSPLLIPYSMHKIGVQIIEHRLDWYIGINLLYNKDLLKTYNPFTTLKLTF